jgi:hypothetical protein
MQETLEVLPTLLARADELIEILVLFAEVHMSLPGRLCCKSHREEPVE